MRRMLCLLGAVVFMASCTRKDMDPQPSPLPVLKYTIQRDSAERIMRVMHYNEFKLVTFDTLFETGTSIVGMNYLNTYNSKGKRLRSEVYIPFIYTAGFYWAWQDHYKDDTIPLVTYRYFKGNQVAKITHTYDAAGNLIEDSTYHTPNYGTFTYLTRYEYDVNGRLISTLDLNDTRDTTSYITYQYSGNTVEKLTMKIDYVLSNRSFGKSVTEYDASGKILSEKGYTVPGGQLNSQVDYTYDATGNLLKKISTSVSSPTEEERYTIDAATGVTATKEYYYNNKLRHITTYYYE